ncbi:MAG: hypothetical protein GY940_41980 [bacterium]|nr:hypothetical protein [bacterium]
MNEMPEFRYRGARALTILLEKETRLFIDTWKKAKAAGVTLPEVRGNDYSSLETLLVHVLHWGKENFAWCCESLELPDPGFKPTPAPENIEAEVEGYFQHLTETWRTPLTNAAGRQFYYKTYTSKWKTQYCIDAMLEHLVLHPMRHRFQLEERMG